MKNIETTNQRPVVWRALLTTVLGLTFIVIFIGYQSYTLYMAWLGGYFLFRLSTLVLNTSAVVCFYFAGRYWFRGVVRPAPGTGLTKIARFIWSKRSYERIFEPLICDMRLEYQEALRNGETWHARWIWMRGHLSFWSAAGVFLVTRIVKGIWAAAS